MYHAKKRDTAWTPEVKPEIEIKEDKWIARLEIPFSLITPIKENEIAPDTVWNINVGRMIKKIGKY